MKPQEQKVAAWIVAGCPDCHFMPTTCYDRIFTQWEDKVIGHNIAQKMSPEYWKSKGFEVIELVECDEADATHWIVNGKYGVFWEESANAARRLGKTVVPVRAKQEILK